MVFILSILKKIKYASGTKLNSTFIIDVHIAVIFDIIIIEEWDL